MDKLVEDLAKQIWYICWRALEAVQGNNDNAIQQLVSAIRIIEREERLSDFIYLKINYFKYFKFHTNFFNNYFEIVSY